MDFVIYSGYYLALFAIPIAIYSLFFKQNTKNKKDFLYLIKYYFAKSTVKNYQNELTLNLDPELENGTPKITNDNRSFDLQYFNGLDSNGNSISLKITLKHNFQAEVQLILRLASTKRCYTFPSRKIALYTLTQNQWRCKDLQIEVLEPFKRLRICFNGLLSPSGAKPEHVRFNFLWIAGAKPLFYPCQANTALLTEAVASAKWKDGDWLSFLGDTTKRGYEQFGTLKGFINGENFSDDLILNLQSVRSRFWGIHNIFVLDQSIRLFFATKCGCLISVNVENVQNGAENVKYGQIVLANGELSTISGIDIDLNRFQQPTNVFTIHIEANRKVFQTVFHLNLSQMVNITGNGYKTIEIGAECDFDTKQARGIVEFWYGTNEFCDNKQFDGVFNMNSIKCDKFVVGLGEDEAKCVNLTGGKGSSLAMMKEIEQKQLFFIPDGFVVTVNAFNRFVRGSKRVQKSLEMLEDVFCKRIEADFEETCKKVVNTFTTEQIPTEITTVIKTVLKNQPNSRWAVRSSGICEDSEDLSAAGQNETFLGCKTIENVLEAILSCWASLFTYQSVQYRHQHGLPIKSEMAVVVQKMVASDCAGVLFTCHPTTANPCEMLITSNHGLGESVVSGLSEPDTIILHRDFNNTISIKSKTIGSKNKMYKMSEGNGIEEEQGQTTFSLSDEQALRLGKVGVELENWFKDARDIEWAFYNNDLYLLQARPITTLNNWTDFELLHEFDYANLSEDVVFTVANTGEVFPGCISILTLTTVAKKLSEVLQIAVDDRNDDFTSICLGIFQHHVFIDVVNSIHRNVNREINLASKTVDLAIFGHAVINETIQKLVADRFGYINGLKAGKQFIKMVKNAWGNETRLKYAKKQAGESDIGINLKNDTIQEMYTKINNYLQVVADLSLYHCKSTSVSVFYQIMTMTILAEKNTDFNNDHYIDIAQILSSCEDVVSAEIPATLEKIANILKDDKLNREFAELDPKLGPEWLSNNSPKANAIFREFITMHGHRALAEFDIMNDTWGMDPVQVIRMIQANCRVEGRTIGKQSKSVDEVIAELISPKKTATRKILRFLMLKSRRAVGIREQTKSEIVRVVHKLRLGYRQMAAKMVDMGLLPNVNLVFYLSHFEVGEIVKNRGKNSLIISKALRRQRLFSKWNQLKFPEVSYGLPKPETENEVFTRSGDNNVKLTGTPVCSGVVKARACVINSLDEIHQLQNGDILITYSTDIGWSPYFPMLSGVVTELGGLVSHGAVIAREYGLPTIVGAQGATKVFKTGDIVVLSGKTGSIELI